MSYEPLPRLEMTITNLAAYLMVAHQKHPKLILGTPDSPSKTSRSSIRLRISQHYTAALLASGLPTTDEELQRAALWFADPAYQHQDIDEFEMIRLEALLNLRPDDESVNQRLKRLVMQRSSSNGLFRIVRTGNENTESVVFDTVWAIKIIMAAREKGILQDLITYSEIQRSLDAAFHMAVEDKDMALLLRLQFELTPELEPLHLNYLSDLLQRGYEHHFVWGLRAAYEWKKVEPALRAMQRFQLTPDMIGDCADEFLKMIVNTCYVIENLAPLRTQYQFGLTEALQKSIELWWNQFNGENAWEVLRGLFEDEYQFMRILCRTLIAAHTYVGQTLGTQLWLSNVRTASQSMIRSEKEEIEKALRHWIGIKFSKEPIRLELGLSKANVARIYPTIYNPMNPDEQILGRSLIVKYGPKDDIEKERLNYEKLPERIRDHFVRIPNIVYESERNQAFVLMEDLSGYRTLFEHYDKLLRYDNLNLAEMLGTFLTEIHHQDYDPKNTAKQVHVREIYFRPMLDQIDYIFNQVSRLKTYQLLFDAQSNDFLTTFEGFLNLHNAMLKAMGTIIQNQAYFDDFPLAYMHGDLHSRNIMVLVGKNRKANSDNFFKLIDMEKLRSDGDVAHDAGQLLTDLELLRVTSKKTVSWKVIENQEKLVRDLRRIYLDFAGERRDKTFETRLDLAKARAFIRIAKGQSKRIAKYLEFRGQQQAFELIAEAMHFAQGANLHLDNVSRKITQGAA